MTANLMVTASGISYFLAAILLVAAVIKLRTPLVFAGSLQRLLPASAWALPLVTPKRLALAVAMIEILTALSLASLGAQGALIASAVGFAMCVVFFAAIRRAIRLGVSCGCFGYLSTGPAGPAETLRGLLLLASSGGLLILRLAADTAAPQLSAGALLLFASLILASIATVFAASVSNSKRAVHVVTDAEPGRDHVLSSAASRREFLRRSAGVVAGGFGVGTGLLSANTTASATAPPPPSALGIGRTIEQVAPPKVLSYETLPAAKARDLVRPLAGHGMLRLMARNLSRKMMTWGWDAAEAVTLHLQSPGTNTVEAAFAAIVRSEHVQFMSDASVRAVGPPLPSAE